MADKNKTAEQSKLSLWQERLERNFTAYTTEFSKMDARELLYAGDEAIKELVKNDKTTTTPHVRNICAEIVEAQVNSTIPQPKVTAHKEADAEKAKLIEDMLRAEIDRLPMETLNDMIERTVPIQGGACFLVEWDNNEVTYDTVGEITISMVHPKQIVPQDGVYSGIEDMDYIIIKVPQTKEFIRKKYGVTVVSESEEEPEIRGTGTESTADDMVTQYIAYYYNDDGGIGMYSWVNDTELADLDDYQMRRLRKCMMCGAIEAVDEIKPLDEPTMDGTPPVTSEMDSTAEDIATETRDDGACAYCGANKWEDEGSEYEEIYGAIARTDGTLVAPAPEPIQVGYEETVDEMGNATPMTDIMGLPVPILEVQPHRVPYYKPDIYPLILQKNVSVYGKFLGDSDVDKMAAQQNTTNRIEAKIIDKLVASGSVLTLPADGAVTKESTDMRVYRPSGPQDMTMVQVLDLEGNIEQDLAYLSQIYEEARQVIGITDSFQGRKDTTATSGVAKEFAASQSAGRLESKRVMKEATYAKLFEAIFKFKLAYTDEVRPITTADNVGNAEYKQFSRYDFLEQNEQGEWIWNDKFIFSVDTNAPLASNREAMWQETRLNLQTGAFGDPSQLDTLILFWSRMELSAYPGAGQIKKALEDKLEQQQLMQAQMMQQQMAMAQAQMMGGMPPTGQQPQQPQQTNQQVPQQNMM